MPLTSEQKRALWGSNGAPIQSLRIVSARPGTGKTTTLTQYCIDLAEGWGEHLKPWQGMAAISYTNVAKEELQKKIRALGKANSLLSGPHFVGTIDSFLNQYIFLPFGASAIGASKRPKLAGEPYGIWRASPSLVRNKPADAYSPIFFDCYTIDMNGRPVRTDTVPRRVNGSTTAVAQKVTDANIEKILKLKQYVWKQGFVLQNDANYFAYKVLKDSPDLTRFFVKRFPVLIIDEAQDMTEVQHALLNHLKEAGQQHMVLMGDEYQAIYEWNTARPQLFVDKKQDVEWDSKTISETFRCSAPICAILTSLADDGTSLVPYEDGKNMGYNEMVRVTEYDTDTAQQAVDIRAAIEAALSLLSGKQAHDDNASNTKTLAILGRSRDDVDTLQASFSGEAPRNKQLVTWDSKFTKSYLKVIFYLLKKDHYRAFKSYEALLFEIGDYESVPAMRISLNAVWNPKDATPISYRKYIFEDLHAITTLLSGREGMLISACVSCCELQLKCINAAILLAMKNDCQGFSAAKSQQDRDISTFLVSRDERIFFEHPDYGDVRIIFSTVHGVKGETYDGVLFYTKAKTGSCSCTPAKQKWVDILQHNLIECENKRIAYVALSRAAQVLHIMTPSASKVAWEALL